MDAMLIRVEINASTGEQGEASYQLITEWGKLLRLGSNLGDV
jgi:hypothetical protein